MRKPFAWLAASGAALTLAASAAAPAAAQRRQRAVPRCGHVRDGRVRDPPPCDPVGPSRARRVAGERLPDRGRRGVLPADPAVKLSAALLAVDCLSAVPAACGGEGQADR